ncbi:MAG: outer membrane protein assembly factor BamE [Desulfuromonadales bacterium]|nr:outer membrane protein assembly factor BamE [Desulfuromonadales bacterium]
MRMRLWFVLLTALLLAGCAPMLPLHQVDLGMNKKQVLEQLGRPSSVTGSGTEEYLYYVPLNRFWQRYYVYLVNGRVQAYGRLGAQTEPIK